MSGSSADIVMPVGPVAGAILIVVIRPKVVVVERIAPIEMAMAFMMATVPTAKAAAVSTVEPATVSTAKTATVPAATAVREGVSLDHGAAQS